MRKGLSIVVVLLTVFLAACHHKPDPLFHDTTGQSFRFSQLRGHWIFINYWATWCHACVHEVDALNQFYRNNKDKKVLVYGVNFDQLKGAELTKAIKTLKIKFPVLLERPNAVLNLQAVGVVPTTFVINPKGELVQTLLGPQSLKKLSNVLG